MSFGPWTQPVHGGMLCPDPDNQGDFWKSDQTNRGHTVGQFNLGTCSLCSHYKNEYDKVVLTKRSDDDYFTWCREAWERDNRATAEEVEKTLKGLTHLLSSLEDA